MVHWKVYVKTAHGRELRSEGDTREFELMCSLNEGARDEEEADRPREWGCCYDLADCR